MSSKVVQTKTGSIRFSNGKRGLYCRLNGQPKRRLCGFVKIAGLATQEYSPELFVVVRILNDSGRKEDIHIRRSEFRRRDQVMQMLCNTWLDCPTNKDDEELLFAYLKSFKPRPKFVLLQRTGWFKGAYTFPEIVVGKATPIPKYVPLAPSHNLVGGTLADWTSQVGRIAEASDRITFALAASFYALVLPYFKGETSVTFHFFGLSSHGKTSLTIASQSVHEWAGRDDLKPWDVTPAGLSEAAASHCDRLLAFDEMVRLGDDNKVIAKRIKEAAFVIASGQGRIRSIHYGHKGNPTKWRVVVLSTGEFSVSENAFSVGAERLGGDLVRLMDIPALANQEHGIFNRLPKGYDTSEAAIAALEEATAQNFGYPAREFIRRFSANREKSVALLERWEARFFDKANVPPDKWERRFARRFARPYAAAMLARKFKIVPWSSKWTRQAAVRCYHAARQAVPNHGLMLQEAQAAVQNRLRDKAAFLDLRKGKPKANALAAAQGYIKADPNNGSFYAIRPEVLQEWIGPKLDVRIFAKHLDRQGLLVKTKRDAPTKPVMIRGIKGKPRYYCLRHNILKMPESA